MRHGLFNKLTVRGAAWLCAVGVLLAASPGMARTAPDAPTPHLLHTYPLAGAEGWDYLALDASARRLYVSHGDRVLVLDADHGNVLGTLRDTSGVHGIALAPGLHRGYTSNGKADSVTVFDPATLEVEAQVKVTGHNPDAIVYDPFTRRVFTFNGHSANATAIDAATNAVVATIALPGKPEFAVSDGAGHLFANIEDKSELVKLDARTGKILATWSLAPGESPSGLALDARHQRLFSVCDNGWMMVLDARSGRRVASVPIGDGPDAVAYDARRGLVYSSNGESGTLTVVSQDDANHYRVLANVPTQKSARTLALDPRSGNVYLAAARFGPLPPASAAQPHPRAPMLDGSFVILVMGR